MSNIVSVQKLSMFGVALALLALATILIVGQFSSTAKADSHEFTGFWMAVDPTDGGFNRLSLVDNGDDTVNLDLSETHVSSCAGGPGKLWGVGDLLDADTFEVSISIQCISDKKHDEGQNIGDVIVFPAPVTFTFVDGNDNLIEFYFAPFDLLVPYHRVSSN